MSNPKRWAIRAVFIFLAVLVCAHASIAQTRRITTAGVLSEPGAYVLDRTLQSSDSGPTITIVGNNITLDLGGQSLIGPGNKQGTGVLVTNVTGVRVFNGVIAGFGVGVEVQASSHVALEALHITGVDQGGTPPSIDVGVMIANSRAVVVADNAISRSFLGVFVRGGASSGNRITRNTIVGGQNGQLGICYNPDASGSAAAPTGDLVTGNLISRFNVGIQTSAQTRRNIFRDNDIAYFMQGVQEITANSNTLERNTSVQIAR
jgi:hypothetical protein